MKITLVRLVFKMENLRPLVEIPLGLLSLATVLDEAGYEVKIVDLQMLLAKNILPFSDQYYKQAGRLIAADEPELLGFTALCNSYPATILLTKECRQLLPKIPIILGGPQATFVDESTLREFPWIDLIVRGEGEGVILDLVKTLETNGTLAEVLGITYRTASEQIVRNADQAYLTDLDLLPYPNYRLLDFFEDYFSSGAPISLDVGRGCPYNCRYCSTSLLWRRQFRMKSPERLVAEISKLQQGFGVKAVKLTHDLFTVNKKMVLDFCHLLRENCPGVVWSCSARTSTIDQDILDEFSKSGCQMIFYGIESGSLETLKYFRKDIDLNQALKVVQATLQKKIKLMTSFIFGAPLEDEASINQTLLLGLKCKILGTQTAQMHLLVAESGTDVFLENQNNLLLNPDLVQKSSRLINSDARLEMELIKNYPKIFSTFYLIKTENILPEKLLAIEQIYSRAISYFPRTIYVILLEKEWQPLEFFAKWQDWLDHRQDTREELIDSFLFFIADLHYHGQFVTPYLLDLVTYEKALADFHQRNYLITKTHSQDHVKSEDYLLLSTECAVAHFQFNIPQILLELKNFSWPTTSKEDVFMIFRYLGGSNVKSMITNQFTYDLLNRSTDQIKYSQLKQYMLEKWAHVDGCLEADLELTLNQLVANRFLEIA